MGHLDNISGCCCFVCLFVLKEQTNTYVDRLTNKQAKQMSGPQANWWRQMALSQKKKKQDFIWSGSFPQKSTM